MKRIIRFYTQLDDGQTITNNFVKEIFTETFEEFSEYLSRFFVDDTQENIKEIEEEGKIYSLNSYINDIMTVDQFVEFANLYFKRKEEAIKKHKHFVLWTTDGKELVYKTVKEFDTYFLCDGAKISKCYITMTQTIE